MYKICENCAKKKCQGCVLVKRPEHIKTVMVKVLENIEHKYEESHSK